jgi:hypothetical protein
MRGYLPHTTIADNDELSSNRIGDASTIRVTTKHVKKRWREGGKRMARLKSKRKKRKRGRKKKKVGAPLIPSRAAF